VLIHGASGGVGTALLQLGRLAGLEMYGTCSSRGASAVSELGGIPIDYQQQDFVKEMQDLPSLGADVVFDSIGGAHMWRSRKALHPGRAAGHRGGAPAHLRDDLQRQPCHLRAAEHSLSAARCRRRILPSTPEVQGRQRRARNRNSPNVDRRKGKWQVANRRVPKHQDLRSPSRSPSCNLVELPPSTSTQPFLFVPEVRIGMVARKQLTSALSRHFQ